jgi:hypothetical protein
LHSGIIGSWQVPSTQTNPIPVANVFGVHSSSVVHSAHLQQSNVAVGFLGMQVPSAQESTYPKSLHLSPLETHFPPVQVRPEQHTSVPQSSPTFLHPAELHINDDGLHPYGQLSAIVHTLFEQVSI